MILTLSDEAGEQFFQLEAAAAPRVGERIEIEFDVFNREQASDDYREQAETYHRTVWEVLRVEHLFRMRFGRPDVQFVDATVRKAEEQ